MYLSSIQVLFLHHRHGDSPTDTVFVVRKNCSHAAVDPIDDGDDDSYFPHRNSDPDIYVVRNAQHSLDDPKSSRDYLDYRNYFDPKIFGMCICNCEKLLNVLIIHSLQRNNIIELSLTRLEVYLSR